MLFYIGAGYYYILWPVFCFTPNARVYWVSYMNEITSKNSSEVADETVNESIDVSIVVPLFNEADNVHALVEQIQQQLTPSGVAYEILLVDDGSSDETWLNISKLENNIPAVKGIKLSRNFGHQKALLAGLDQAQGQAIISMDGDLQHPPETLPVLIKHWQAGSKIVHTKRCQQEHLGWFKRASSDGFYRVFSWLSGVEIEQGSSDFRLIDHQVLKELKRFNDVDPFIRGAVRWLGFDDVSTTVEYNVGLRVAGESQYTLSKMLAFANSAVVSFSTKPLLIGIWLGLITSLLAFAELGYIMSQYFVGNTVPGWASTVGIMALLFGVLFVLLGVIGLYLARIHTALQERPKFIIEQSTQTKSKTP